MLGQAAEEIGVGELLDGGKAGLEGDAEVRAEGVGEVGGEIFVQQRDLLHLVLPELARLAKIAFEDSAFFCRLRFDGGAASGTKELVDFLLVQNLFHGTSMDALAVASRLGTRGAAGWARGLGTIPDQFAEARAQANHRRGMNLGNARFADAQHRAHFFHGEFFEMIESEHLALARGKLADGLLQQAVHFGAQRQVVRILLVRRGTILRG